MMIENEYLLSQKNVNNCFCYFLYLYSLGFSIFMMYTSYKSMTIIENAVNNLDKFTCVTDLVLKDLNINTSNLRC